MIRFILNRVLWIFAYALIFSMFLGGFLIRVFNPELTEIQLLFTFWWYWLLLIALVLAAWRLAKVECD